MPQDPPSALRPKVPGACTLCDAECREVLRIDPQSRKPLQFGRPLPGSRMLSLRMLDGSFSDHTICARCTPKPQDLPQLWERQVMLFLETCQGRHFMDGTAERFARNIPIGILEVRPA